MSSYALRVNSVFGAMLRILGIGALIAGGLTVAIAAIAAVLLLSPLVFWVAWNVLDFAHAVGLPELSFWGIVLATCFSFSAGCKVVIAGIIFSSIHPGSQTVRRRCAGPSPRSATSSPSRSSLCLRHDRTRMRTSGAAARHAEAAEASELVQSLTGGLSLSGGNATSSLDGRSRHPIPRRRSCPSAGERRMRSRSSGQTEATSLRGPRQIDPGVVARSGSAGGRSHE
jgi:hypothetical protein